MLSIVICSVKPSALEQVKKNVAETIGVPHEIIAIDNSANRYGICQAYNEGGSKAQFPYICFMHEDISFETPDWGKIVCGYLSNRETGLVGVSGGDAKSGVPTSWTVPMISTEINTVQYYKREAKPAERIRITNTAVAGNLKKVVALDGLWLCTRKEIFEEIKFDEKTFTGFHGYDLDYSLQVGRRYNMYVVFDIVIHHFSEGTLDRSWLESTVLLSKKWKRHLPVSIYDIGASEYRLHHWKSLQVYLQQLMDMGYGKERVLREYFAYSFTVYFNLRRFLSMGKYVVSTLHNRSKAIG